MGLPRAVIMQKVYVYRFCTVDGVSGVSKTSPRMATLAVIRSAGGIAEAISARLVRSDAIDSAGFYPKRWGFD
jgi:hypothetical protein